MTGRARRPGLWPVPGDGVLARQAGLVLLVASGDEAIRDTLLDLLEEVAAAGGDGRRLVQAVEDALIEGGGWMAGDGPAVAAFGPAGATLALLLTGTAWAEITTGAAAPQLLGGQPSVLLRCLAGGPVTEVSAGLGAARADAAPPDPLSRLDGGIARASGLSYIPDHPASPGAASPPAGEGPAVPAATGRAVAAPPGEAPAGLGVEPPAAPRREPAAQAGTELAAQTPAEPAAAVAPAPVIAAAPAQSGQPSGTGPVLPKITTGPEGREFQSFSLLPEDAAGLVVRQAALPVAPAPAQSGLAAPGPVILGAYCKNAHFNDPEARYCAVCGISMNQQTLQAQPGPRPPLGVLILSDGAVFQLDTDYIVGRDPDLDAAVLSGEARPLRVSDSSGTVSRVHARVLIDDWKVLVVDLGSANGTSVELPGLQPQRLAPRVPMQMRAGGQVDLGGKHRFRYESHRGH